MSRSNFTMPLLQMTLTRSGFYPINNIRLLPTTSGRRGLSIGSCSRAKCNSSPGPNNPSDNTGNRKSNSKNESLDTYKFCVDHVKRFDRENYLAGTFITDVALRRIIFGLRAFNVELSLIRDLSNNSDRAKVRFHFWSRLIDEIMRRNGLSSENTYLDKDLAYYKHTPVAKELLDLFSLIHVTEEMETYLKDLIGSRISSKVLGYQAFENMEELELYCVKSNSSIYQLAWRIDLQMKQGPPSKENCDNQANVISLLGSTSHQLGTAQGLLNIIRGIPYNSTKNCCYIPESLLNEFNLTSRNFIGKNLNGLQVRPVVLSIADRCRVLLSNVYSNLSILLSSNCYYQYRHLRYLFLPGVSIESNLKRLKRYDYNVCEPSYGRRNELLAINLKLASIHYKAPII